MNSYEKFVTEQTRRQFIPRTLQDAFRGADYGTAIWRCEKPQHWSSDAFVEALVIMLMCGFIGYFLAIYVG